MPDLSILDSPFLMTGEALHRLVAVSEQPQALLARPAKYASNDIRSELLVRDEVGIINISGPIVPDPFLAWLMGGITPESIAQDITRAMDDPAISAVILNVNSPGGAVTGINELSDLIYAARDKKRAWCYVGGVAASGAYWIGSAAEKIIIEPTAGAGSIGVVAAMSKKDPDEIEIVSTSSPKKRLDPATAEGRADVLARVDAIADIFVASVARNRNVTIEKVLADFGQGSVLVGAAAVNAGLADEVGSLEKTIAKIRSSAMPEIKTLAELEAQFPALVAEARGPQVDTDKLKAEAAEAATERILGLAKVHFAAADVAAFEQVVKLGLTPEQFAAAKEALKPPASKDITPPAPPQQAAMSTRLDQIIAAGAVEVGTGAPEQQGGQDFMSLVRDYRDKHKCSLSDAMAAIQASNPRSHQDYINGANKSGQVH